MLQPIFTGPARRDLTAIWEHIALDSAEAADRFVDEVDRRIHLLCAQPNQGERDHRVGSCRRVIIGRYLLFYEQAGDELRVLRLYHSARRIEKMQLRPDDLA
jgi:plasmid stabilization system protein ParE